MSRNIITERDIRLAGTGAGALPDVARAEGHGPQPRKPDDYLTKLMKYIPAEVVSLYVALDAVVKTSTHGTAESQAAYWFIFAVCLFGTPLYLWRRGKVDKFLHLLISTVAFAVWIFAIGGPFDSLEWYQGHKLYPALALPIYTFLVALVDP